jgi:hypothetical protein
VSYLLSSILITIFLWLAQYSANLLIGSFAILFLIVIPHSFWINKYNKQALVILLLGGLLLDILNPWTVPIYFLINLIAGAVYFEIIEPYLSIGNTLIKFLSSIIWLVLWRVLYLLIITLGGLLNLLPTPRGEFMFIFWLKWIGGGLIIWLIMELIFKVINHFMKKSIRYKKYA